MKIKFSYEYTKMPEFLSDNFNEAELLAVFFGDRNDLHKDFVEYDTEYWENGEKGNYPLPQGKLLILLLKTDTILWTTIRRWTPQKEKYYRSNVGEIFKIELKGADE